MSECLIVVDVQNDFLPGGNLAVPDGDKVIPIINNLMEQFEPDKIFVTRDMHPKDHGSFASSHKGRKIFDLIELNGVKQVLWPDHCIIGTRGAELSEDLDIPEDATIIDKGMNKEYDSYSGFKDAGGSPTGLEDALKNKGVLPGSFLYIVGLVLDYCVTATAIDAANLGYEVSVILEACREVAPEITELAIKEMAKVGVVVL